MLENLYILIYKESQGDFKKPKYTFTVPLMNCFTIFYDVIFSYNAQEGKSMDNSVSELKLAIKRDFYGLL